MKATPENLWYMVGFYSLHIFKRPSCQGYLSKKIHSTNSSRLSVGRQGFPSKLRALSNCLPCSYASVHGNVIHAFHYIIVMKKRLQWRTISRQREQICLNCPNISTFYIYLCLMLFSKVTYNWDRMKLGSWRLSAFLKDTSMAAWWYWVLNSLSSDQQLKDWVSTSQCSRLNLLCWPSIYSGSLFEIQADYSNQWQLDKIGH